MLLVTLGTTVTLLVLVDGYLPTMILSHQQFWFLPVNKVNKESLKVISKVEESYPVVLDQGGVDDVTPEVGEHEGAGHQQVEDGDLHLANSEGEAEDVEAKVKLYSITLPYKLFTLFFYSSDPTPIIEMVIPDVV